MELDRKIIKVSQTRALIFNGTTENGVMSVTHVVDQANGTLFHFYHPEFMGKSSETPFECSERKRITDAVKRKYGVASVKGFKNYECRLTVIADAEGNNGLFITDIQSKQDIVSEFVKHHWRLEL